NLAVSSEKKSDEEKMIGAFQRVASEDPTFKVNFDPETKETLVSGMGETQLKLIIERVEEKNNLKVLSRLPKIAYRETICKNSSAQYRHKKQSGGHGQFGEVFLDIEPLERGKGLQFVDKIVGGAIPKNFIPGVEKGIQEAMEEGVLAKFPMTDIRVTLTDGSFHPVDSSELSFKLAALHAMKKAVSEAGPVLLEPVMDVEVHTDKDLIGDILGDIQGRRGKVLGVMGEDDNNNQLIKAKVPLSELLEYSTEIRSLTRDRATFEMDFSHYEQIVGKLADKVIGESIGG
ncbi:MAG: elongation factor G, partial [Spirochaetota bacterium]|nr:elongation factor G [Spirochaetota bacterium]